MLIQSEMNFKLNGLVDSGVGLTAILYEAGVVMETDSALIGDEMEIDETLIGDVIVTDGAVIGDVMEIDGTLIGDVIVTDGAV